MGAYTSLQNRQVCGVLQEFTILSLSPAVQLQGLTKHYGDFAALSEVDLTIQRGELFGQLGPNGAGKTTAIRLIMGALRATAGLAHVDGHDRLGLRDAMSDYAVNYSRGMKKKLALVLAMMHQPLVLILDEPSNGLDPYANRTLHTLLREWVDLGRTVFFSTHRLEQAERLCTRLSVLADGRVAAVGTLDELRAGLPQGATLEDVFFATTGLQTPGPGQ